MSTPIDPQILANRVSEDYSVLQQDTMNNKPYDDDYKKMKEDLAALNASPDVPSYVKDQFNRFDQENAWDVGNGQMPVPVPIWKEQ